jgi:hypothetical protein
VIAAATTMPTAVTRKRAVVDIAGDRSLIAALGAPSPGSSFIAFKTR